MTPFIPLGCKNQSAINNAMIENPFYDRRDADVHGD